jgi:hypothetical protein
MGIGQDELPEARRIAILKSSLGAEGYRVCLSLCAGDNLSFDDVLARLTDRFAPKVSNIFARSVFHRRAQLQGESCVQFVTALRSLMAKCGYDEHVQAELLRDRFVAGCDSDTIREKLLLEPDTLTLEQALVIAGNSERVAVESKNVHSLAQVDSSSVMQVSSSGRGQGHRWSPRGTGGSCFACGRSDHKRDDPRCPAWPEVQAVWWHRPFWWVLSSEATISVVTAFWCWWLAWWRPGRQGCRSGQRY